MHKSKSIVKKTFVAISTGLIEIAIRYSAIYEGEGSQNLITAYLMNHRSFNPMTFLMVKAVI